MAKKLTSLLLAFVLTIAMLPIMSSSTANQVNAATAGVTNGETYTIVSAYNGKAITQTDLSTFYANCVVWNTNAMSDLARWKVEERGEYYSFTNIVSGKSMKICGTSNGSTTDFNGYDNSNNYKWKLVPITSGIYAGCYYIVSAVKNADGAEIYAEVTNADGNTNDGTQVRLWTKQDNEPRQIWRIQKSNAENTTFTEHMADQALQAFKNKYFVYNSTTGNNSLGDGFWGIAEVMEAMLDGYETTGKPAYKDMFVGTYNDFLVRNGDYWTNNNYNDDISWAAIASVRAYLLFGEQKYLDIAKKNFDFMYNRASTYGGGLLRWCEESGRNTTSNACINGPATVCASYLAIATGDESYWDKARTVYLAQRNSNLYVADGDEVGRVNDCINPDGSVENYWVSTYNQGTYLGSAVMLYEHFGDEMYYTDACNIMKYTRNHLCYNNILKDENTNTGDLSGMRGILMRYMRKFIVDFNKGEYISFFTDNARIAWMNRNSSDLMQCAWQQKTPENVTWDSFAAYNAISLMANIPTYRAELERDAYSTIEAEDMDYCKGLISENSSGTSGGRSLGGVQNGHYTAYYNVDFGDVGCSQITLNYSKAPEGNNAVGTVEFRLDSTDGEIIATADVQSTGDWSTWKTITVDTLKRVTGVRNIYVMFLSNTSYVCNFDSFQFTEKSVNAYTQIAATSYDNQNGVVIDKDAEGKPHNIGGVNHGDWILFQGVDFGNQTAVSMELNYSSQSGDASGYIEVYADDMDGTPIGKITLPNTGASWSNYVNLKGNLSIGITGKHNIYIKFVTTKDKTYVANLAWFTFSTVKYVEETTTEEPTTPEETTTEDSSAVQISDKLSIEGFQISTSYGGIRVVGSVEPIVNGKQVKSFGFVYALSEANGTNFHIQDDDMVINEDNYYIRSYETTQAGISNVVFGNSQTATYIVRTMTYGAYTKEAFDTKYKVRTYAVLEDGSTVYSNIVNYSIYKVADALYQKILMNTKSSHDYLYHIILKTVNSDYQEVDFHWSNAIVKK